MPRPHVTYPSKRALDIAGACVLLLIFLPAILCIAWLIKKQAGAPIIYKQERVGLNGVPFWVLKFRTMITNADEVLTQLLANNEDIRKEWLVARKLKNDPRITQVGLFLRKTSLDELPQLINVLRGEMSLVGPRPVIAEELEYYEADKPAYLSVRPGLTGAWQISGRNDISYAERVRMDVNYVNNPSFLEDLTILVRTISVVLFKRGAY